MQTADPRVKQSENQELCCLRYCLCCNSYFNSVSSGFELESSDFDSENCSEADGEEDWSGFLNCTMIMVILSHPSPPAVDGAKHLSRTLSHTTESLLSCIDSHVKTEFILNC